MSGTRSFSCPACGKQFIWHPTAAGSSVHCACGRRLIAPIEPPPLIESYDMSDDVPRKKSTSHGTATAGPRMLEYRSKSESGEFNFTDFLHQLRDPNVLLPVFAVLIGIAFRYILPTFLSNYGARSGSGAALITLGLLINIVTMLAGVMIVANFVGADLGSVPVTVARLCAVAVLGSILFAVIASIDKSGGIRGMVIGLHCVFLLNWVCFSMMFEFDIQEALFAVAVVGLMQAMGACALWHG